MNEAKRIGIEGQYEFLAYGVTIHKFRLTVTHIANCFGKGGDGGILARSSWA